MSLKIVHFLIKAVLTKPWIEMKVIDWGTDQENHILAKEIFYTKPDSLLN